MSTASQLSAAVTSAESPVAVAASEQTAQALMQALIQVRQTTLPKQLGEPPTNCEQLNGIFARAARAPDHGALPPWRFVQVPSKSELGTGRLVISSAAPA